MAYLINRINEELSKTGYTQRSRQARDWLRQKINQLSVSSTTLMRDQNRLTETQFIGGMFFFYYDPKTKDSLPYYDRFPLVIPVEQYPTGFLGMNLHYLHPKQRIILLDKLSEFKNNDKYDNSTKLMLSYKLLKSASKIYEVAPCIKHYLAKHVESRFVEINANEWDIAALLSVELFEKASSSKVWADSRKKF